jgi:hypothetical protein
MKNQNIILGGVLLAVGVGAYLFFTKNKVTDSIVEDTKVNSEKETTTETDNNTSSESTVGKSNPADVPMNTPIVSAESIQQQQEVLAKQKADAEAILKAAQDKEFAFKNMLSGKTEAQVLEEAKAISATIAEMRRKQSGYKKASSRANIQTVIDGDIAKLLALGYTPLDNGEVKKL